MTLGEKILKYRKKAGISQEELADKLNVTRQSISLWETDQTLPSLDNLITLAELFNVSLDELCGRKTQYESNDTGAIETAVATPHTTTECIARSKTVENKQLLGQYFWLRKRASVICCVVGIICALLPIFTIIISPYTDNVLVLIPVAITLPFAIALVCLVVPARKRFVARITKTRPNSVFNFNFFVNHFEVIMTSDITSYSYLIKYEQVKKVKQNDLYIFVYFNNIVLPIEKASLGDNLNIVLKLLQAMNYCANPSLTKVSPKRRRAIKITLYVMFIISILSVYMAALAIYTDVQYDRLHQYLPTYVEHLWIMHLFILFPLASLIFGVVCVVKKIAGRRNIIAGVIMCAVLLSGGSCTTLKNKYIMHDHNYVAYFVEAVSPITLPKVGRTAYSTLGAHQLGKSWDAMIQAPSKKEMLDCAYNGKIEYVRHLEQLNLPSDFLEPYYRIILKDFDGFCLYNYQKREANTFSGYGYYIFVAYDERYETFYVLHRLYIADYS